MHKKLHKYCENNCKALHVVNHAKHLQGHVHKGIMTYVLKCRLKPTLNNNISV